MKKTLGVIAVLWGVALLLVRHPAINSAAYRNGVMTARIFGLVMLGAGAWALYNEFRKKPADAAPARLGWLLPTLVAVAVLGLGLAFAARPLANFYVGYLMAQAQARRGQGDFAGEAAQLDRVLNFAPGLTPALGRRALLRVIVKNDADAALHDAEGTLGLDPKNENALTARCMAWMIKGEWNAAIDACSLAEREAKSPEFKARLPAYLALSNVRLGRFSQALGDSMRALSFDPKNLDALQAQAAIYSVLGPKQAAQRAVQSVLAATLKPGPELQALAARVDDPNFMTAAEAIGKTRELLAALATLELRFYARRRAWATRAEDLVPLEGNGPRLEEFTAALKNPQLGFSEDTGRLLIGAAAPAPLAGILTARGDAKGFSVDEYAWDGGKFSAQAIAPEPAPRAARRKKR